MAKADKPATKRRESLSETVLKELQGDWVVVYSELEGEMTPITEKTVLTHRGNTFTVTKAGKVVHEGRFTVDVIKMPYEVTLIFSKSNFEGNLGGPRIGIALLEGDTLKTVFGPVGPVINPKFGFLSYRDSQTVQTIHQRVGTERGTGLLVSPNKAVAVW
jgi:uncharacterized protein (TIGR03067 family)